MVRQNVAGFVYDETRNGPAALKIPVWLSDRPGDAKKIKKIKRVRGLRRRIAATACGRRVHRSLRVDVDYSGIDLRGDLGKCVRKRHRVRNDQGRRFLSFAR